MVISIVFIAKGWHVLTGGFRTNKILPRKDLRCEKIENPMKKDFFKIFNQKFYYLGKGCQVYVFESEDKKYVIKFLRHHRYKTPFWFWFLDVVKKGKEYVNERIDYKIRSVRRAYRSYIISFEEFKKETGMLYFHLDRTDHIKKKLKIIDRLGQTWEIDLDKTDFVVQKKLNNLEKFLIKLSKNGEMEKAKIFIDGYFDMIKKRSLKKIKNLDHSGYLRNMGYIEDQIFEIDLGNYVTKEELLKKEGFEKEFLYFHKRLKRWACKRAKNLVEYIDESSEKKLKEGIKVLR